MPVEVRYRCPLTFETLPEGEDPTRRACATCGKLVTDTSRLTRAEALRVFASEGEPCVRVAVDRRGELLFADTVRRVATVLVPAVLAAGSALADEPAPAPTVAAAPSVEPEAEKPLVVYRADAEVDFLMGVIVAPLDRPSIGVGPGARLRHLAIVPWKPPDPEEP